MQDAHPNRKKLSPEEEEIIRSMRAEGCSMDTIGAYLRVGKERVRRFCKENNMVLNLQRPSKARMDELKSIPVSIPEMPNAACRGQETNLFFLLNSSKDHASRKKFVEQTEKAIGICRGCQHQMECLEYALVAEPYGVWGGATDAERQYLRQKYKIECVREVVIRLGTFSNFGYKMRMTMEMLDAKFATSTIVQEYIKTHG